MEHTTPHFWRKKWTENYLRLSLMSSLLVVLVSVEYILISSLTALWFYRFLFFPELMFVCADLLNAFISNASNFRLLFYLLISISLLHIRDSFWWPRSKVLLFPILLLYNMLLIYFIIFLALLFSSWFQCHLSHFCWR